MASTQAVKKGLTLTISALGALWLAACGGSTSILDNSGGSAASGNASGSTGVGGGVGHGGAGGSGGTAGTNSAGAGGVCLAFCPALDCAQGYTLEPGQCCPTCVPNGGAGGTGGSAGVGNAGGVGGCGDVACPDIGCGPGTTPVIEPGNCCPSCVPNGEACTAGEQGYQALLSNLLAQPGAASCMVDADCTLLYGSTQCGAACGASPVNASQVTDMANQLALWEKSYCATCVATYPPCAAPPAPFCEAGQCQLYHRH
jgi:hypothetical protein